MSNSPGKRLRNPVVNQAVGSTHEALMARPILTTPEIAKSTGLSYPGSSAGLNRLIELGIVNEAAGSTRARVFVYTQYLQTLNEGTEAP